MIKLLNEREQIKGVAANFKKQYPKNMQMWNGKGDTNTAVKQLQALDPNAATRDDVTLIIGNDSWVKPDNCDNCGIESWDLILIGTPGDYEENRSIDLCKKCLLEGASLLP